MTMCLLYYERMNFGQHCDVSTVMQQLSDMTIAHY